MRGDPLNLVIDALKLPRSMAHSTNIRSVLCYHLESKAGIIADEAEGGEMSAQAKDVAAYILEKKGSLTGYQLQKLLYYCQAWSLAYTGEPLFDEQIEAWAHGPVVASVSRLHQHLYWVNRRHIADSDSSRLAPEGRCLVDAVLDAYGGLSGDQLEELTHSERPWSDAYNGRTYFDSAPIPAEAMRSYYAGLSAAGPEGRMGHIVPVYSGPRYVYVSGDDYDWLLSDDD